MKKDGLLLAMLKKHFASIITEIKSKFIMKKLGILFPSFQHWRHHPDLNWGVKVLQTSALPLGYGATHMLFC